MCFAFLTDVSQLLAGTRRDTRGIPRLAFVSVLSLLSCPGAAGGKEQGFSGSAQQAVGQGELGVLLLLLGFLAIFLLSFFLAVAMQQICIL